MLVARGTSDNAALFGRYLLEITTGIPGLARRAFDRHALQGARSITATRWWWRSRNPANPPTPTWCWNARASRAPSRVGITNEKSSTLAELAEHTFLVRAGKESSVAATKTYTGQVLMMYLMADALGGAIRTRRPGAHPRIWREDALQLEPEIAALSERYRFMRHAVVVGRGLNYANAFEFALKMMETCYVVAERFSSADFLHGPIALVEPSFPVFAFAPPGVTWPSIGETLRKLQGLHAEIVGDHRLRQLAKSTPAPPKSSACPDE